MVNIMDIFLFLFFFCPVADGGIDGEIKKIFKRVITSNYLEVNENGVIMLNCSVLEIKTMCCCLEK